MRPFVRVMMVLDLSHSFLVSPFSNHRLLNEMQVEPTARVHPRVAGKHSPKNPHPIPMQAKASKLIEILADALRRVEEDSRRCPDDPEVRKLKTAILRGIAELELLRSAYDHSDAA